jgi:hypothetical protein
MCRKAGQGRSDGNPRRRRNFNVYTLEQDRGRLDCSVMRPGETEDAMGAGRGRRITGGRTRRVLRIVLAEFESRKPDIGARRKRQAKGDQQRLRGDGKGGDGADQRPPKTPRTPANAADADHVRSGPTPRHH